MLISIACQQRESKKSDAIMKKVYSHENLTQVHTVKGLLEVNDISCTLKNEHHASGGHVGLESIPVELWITDESQAERAMALIEKALSEAANKPDWTCPTCKETNAGSFESCWNCGALPT